MISILSRGINKAREDVDVLNKLKPGDIILTARDSIIVKFMNIFQSDPVTWGHAMIVRDSVSVYEAHWLIRRIATYEVLKNKKSYLIIRPNFWTDEDTSKLDKVLGCLVGKMYSFKRIGLQALDHITNTNWFTDNWGECTSAQVCSSLVAYAYYVIKRYTFNDVSWKACDPDDIEDDYEKYPERWELVAKK